MLRVVSSFVAAGNPTPVACRKQVESLTRALARLPVDADWQWVVLCDEAGWQRFLRLSGRTGEDEIQASTDLQARTTYVRGTILTTVSGFGADGSRIVAHELAHILAHSDDERVAVATERRWLRATGR